MQLFNEYCLLLSCYAYFTFSPFVPEPPTRYTTGFIMIFVAIFTFLINVLNLVLGYLKLLVPHIRKLHWKYKLAEKKKRLKYIEWVFQQRLELRKQQIIEEK
jgi:hypothetical protein